MYDPEDYEPPEDYDFGPDNEFIEWPRDQEIDHAKESVLRLFETHPEKVFYGRQVEVLLEDRHSPWVVSQGHFHWITRKALNELVKEQLLKSDVQVTAGNNKVRLYWAKKNRYAKRAAKRIVELVDDHTSPELGRALGQHTEVAFAVALALKGFQLRARGARQHRNQIWTETEHDLDWILERDGIAWGVEIKNTWAYIPLEEMQLKVKLCAHLGVRPLFIVRAAAKSYIDKVRDAGGFTLVFRNQIFPVGFEARMRGLTELMLPAACLGSIPEGTIQRFVNYHVGFIK